MSADVKLIRLVTHCAFCAVARFAATSSVSAISDTGTWMQVMAQGWVMSTLTSKAILLGMANLAAGLPNAPFNDGRRFGGRSF